MMFVTSIKVIVMSLHLTKVSSVISPFIQGCVDSMNFIGTFKLIKRSSRIKKFIYDALPLYMCVMVVNFLYGYWYEPYYLNEKSLRTWIIIKFLWLVGWAIPSYMICKIMYYHQFMDLWTTVYMKKKTDSSVNTRAPTPTRTRTNVNVNVWTSMSELLYGIILTSAYYIQTIVFEFFIPIVYIKLLFSVISFSWMISWGVFENKMIYSQMDLFQRITYFESRWAYFLGFGLPTSLLYTFVFDWYIGMNLWYLIVMMLTFRAILSNPTKMNGDYERIRVFWFSEYIASYSIKWILKHTNAQFT